MFCGDLIVKSAVFTVLGIGLVQPLLYSAMMTRHDGYTQTQYKNYPTDFVPGLYPDFVLGLNAHSRMYNQNIGLMTTMELARAHM